MDLLRGFNIVTSIQNVLHDGCSLYLSRVVLKFVGQVVRKLGLPLHNFRENRGQHFRQQCKYIGFLNSPTIFFTSSR
ncbi:hypothetical protein HanPI659440_Chr02g0086241 [Helianthus annuus]|nr:hypothetical protein HanPI659440_Chr02g0086241 [Helianthus annuus]